jgi:MraZ protein
MEEDGEKWGMVGHLSHTEDSATALGGEFLMLLGEFEHNLDEKGRITVPAKFRGRLASGLVVTKGIDPCLWLYPVDVYVDLAQRVNTLSITDPQARDFRRQVFGGAADAVPDKQGRFILPPALREYANIDKQAIIIGLYDHCEVWNPDRWRKRQEEGDNNPDERAKQFANLGI